MKRSLLAVALMIACGMAQANDHRDRTIKGCNIESDYSLTTYREAFVFTRDDAKAPKRMSLGGGKLYVDGREAELNAADQARVAQQARQADGRVDAIDARCDLVDVGARCMIGDHGSLRGLTVGCVTKRRGVTHPL